MDKYRTSIPTWVQKEYTDTCPIYIKKANKKKIRIGYQPIFTKGWNHRIQINFIDYLGMLDSPFNYLLSMYNYCIKPYTLILLIMKTDYVIA